MATYLGLDWAGKGWFGVVLREDGGWDADLFPTIWSAWKAHSEASRIFVDVPIGLPSDDRRQCDVEAKRKLKSRQRSVFYAPVRDAVYERNLDEAKAINETAGYSIQNQAWSLVPRIREVDEFLDSYPSARDRLFETHPELCFASLNGGQPLERAKRSESGNERRQELLEAEFPGARAIYRDCVETFTEPAYAPLVGGRDDILDALVAAVTAQREPDRVASLPVSAPTDERGLPMEIRYPVTTEQTTLSDLTG